MNSQRWLIVAVLAAPLAVTSIGHSEGMAQAKNNLFLHLGLALLIWTLTNWWLRAIVVWSWISFVLAGMDHWAFVGLLGVVIWSLVYQHAATLTETSWRNVQRAITVAALFQVAWMAVQALGRDRLFFAIAQAGTGTAHVDPLMPVPIQGWFSNPMDTGLFLAMSVPAMATVHPILGLVGASMALFMKSTAVLFALVALGLYLAARWEPRALIALVPLAGIAVVGYVSLYDPQGAGYRPAAWRAAWNVAWMRPWLGYGVNALDYRVIIDSDVGRWNFLFSEWLQWWLETGAVGLALAGAYLAWLLRRLRHTWPAGRDLLAPALMLLVLSAISIPFRIGPVALLAALYLGRLDATVRG